jgi:hypothetical protein
MEASCGEAGRKTGLRRQQSYKYGRARTRGDPFPASESSAETASLGTNRRRTLTGSYSSRSQGRCSRNLSDSKALGRSSIRSLRTRFRLLAPEETGESEYPRGRSLAAEPPARPRPATWENDRSLRFFSPNRKTIESGNTTGDSRDTLDGPRQQRHVARGALFIRGPYIARNSVPLSEHTTGYICARRRTASRKSRRIGALRGTRAYAASSANWAHPSLPAA